MQHNSNGLIHGPEPSRRNSDARESNSEEESALAGDLDVDTEAVDLAAEKVHQGMNCTLSAEFAQAVVLFSAALRLDPTQGRIHALRGDAYRLLCEYDKALADFDAAIRLDPTQPTTYISRGLVHRLVGNLNAAIADCCEALRLNPDNGAAYLNRASAYAEMAEQDRAIEDFSAAIRLNPRDLHAHFSRGKAHSNRGEYELAIADFSRVLELNPNYILAHLNRGDAHRNKGDYPQAIFDYSEVLRLHPGNALAYSNRGQATELLGDQDRAIADYSEAIRLDPSKGKVYCSRAILYRMKKQYDLALTDLASAVERNPKDATAYFHRGMIRLARNEFSQAIEEFTEAMNWSPEFVAAYLNRALAHDRMENYSAAIADCTKAIEVDSNLAPAYLIRGTAHAHAHAYTHAIADLSAAIQLDSEFAHAYLERARAYTQRRAFDEALADYDQLLRLDPLNALAFANRGIVYHLKGDLTRAVDDFSYALQLDPKRILAGWNHGLGELARRQCSGLLSDYTEGRRPKRIEASPRTRPALLSGRTGENRLARPPIADRQAPTHTGETLADIEVSPAPKVTPRRQPQPNRAETETRSLPTVTDLKPIPLAVEGSTIPAETASATVQTLPVEEVESSEIPRLAEADELAEPVPEEVKFVILDVADLVEETVPEEPEIPQEAQEEVLKTAETNEEAPAVAPPLLALVQCTVCKVIAIPAEQLADKRVRCGQCQSVFLPVTASSSAPTATKPMPEKSVRRISKQSEYEEPSFFERRKKPVIAAFIALAVLGCFTLLSSGAPKRVRVYPVHGEVKFLGEPIPEAVVELNPINKTNLDVPRPRGIVKEDGTFVLGTYGKEDGAPPGEYEVTVQCYRKARKDQDGFGTNILPAKYATGKTSGLTAHIQIGDNKLPTIELNR